MGFGGISIWQLLIILAIVVLLFGTKKLKGIGSDLGGALKGFKKAINDESIDDGTEADNNKDDEPSPNDIKKEAMDIDPNNSEKKSSEPK